MGDQKKEKSRILYFDVLNILAIVAVIALHHNGIYHHFAPNISRAWSTSLVAECVFYWAVPVFLMLSGANLMRYREKYDTKTFFIKRTLKVLIPFLFWAVAMGVWKYSIGSLKITDFSINNLLNIFFENKEESTYYFMFLILGVYLTIPLLSILTEPKHRKLCWYIVATVFITQSTLPVVLNVVGIHYNTSLSILVSGYTIFVLLGYLLSTQDFTKKQRIIIYVLGILGLLVRLIYTYYFTIKTGTLNSDLHGYTQFHSVLLACAVFVFVKNIKLENVIKTEKLQKQIANIAGCSFGIYLIHKIVMHYEISVFNINQLSWEWRVFGILATYIISLTIIFIIKKIPMAKRLVP